ncbi:MAG: Rieske 2Fe-2S domain-containing protein [Planctomycetota bacterium]
MTETHVDGTTPPPDRRNFLTKAMAVLIGGIVGVVPALAGLSVIFDPIRRRGKGGDGVPFLPVANLDAVPADGKPRLFRVIADKVDAWNLYPKVGVGAVYLRRTPENPDKVIAFNTVCPHLGCFVDTKDDGTYLCPCHDSQFLADGSRGAVCASPRGLDVLNAKVEGDSILVQFMNFETATHEKKPIS